MKKILWLLLLLTAACDDQAPPAPTSQEADQLNEAEGMLNDLAANEEGPAPEGTGPSNRSD